MSKEPEASEGSGISKRVAMASDKEVEGQLFESGNKLVEPPSSVDELLPLLDVRPSFLCKFLIVMF